jgi:hypothetical protein
MSPYLFAHKLAKNRLSISEQAISGNHSFIANLDLCYQKQLGNLVTLLPAGNSEKRG